MGKILDIMEGAPSAYIYILFILFLSIPIIKPLGLPLASSEGTMKTYNRIETLQPGDVVVFSFDPVSMNWMEQGLNGLIVSKHLFQQEGVKVVVFSISEEADQFWEIVREDTIIDNVYGEDYVWLGFLPGMETAVAAVAANIWEAVGGTDGYGTPLEELPMMENIRSADDATIMLNLPRGTPMPYIRQWGPGSGYDVPIYMLPLSSAVAGMEAYIQAGQVEALVAGSRGAAEYEIIMKLPGKAAAGMDAQTMSHLYLVMIIIIGNIGYVLKRYTEGTK